MKTHKLGEIVPFGFSKREGEPFVYLRLPLFPWYGCVYDGANDEYTTGWHFRSLLMKMVTADSEIRVDKREPHQMRAY